MCFASAQCLAVYTHLLNATYCGHQVLAEILQQGARIDDPDAAARQEFVRCVRDIAALGCCASHTWAGCAPRTLCLLWRGACWPGVHACRVHDQVSPATF